MPYKDPAKRKEYLLEYRKRKRREYRALVAKRTTAVHRTPEEQEVEDTRIREYRRHYMPVWNKRNRESRLLQSARSRAKKLGRECTLVKEDIVIPQVCPILGVPFTEDNGPSIDRVDNSKGYTRENIEIISLKANRMKSDATKEELVAFSRMMLSRYDPDV